MPSQLIHGVLASAEGEDTVRTYHCTTLSSRLLSLKAEGHLVITNKRVIFYASGSSYGGNSVLQSEVPIADVSGISSYKGTYFSLGRLLTALVVSFLGAILFTAITTLLTGVLGIGLRNAGASALIGLVLPIGSLVVSFFVPRNSLWRSVLAAYGALLLAGLGGVGFVVSLGGSLFGRSDISGLGAILTILAPIAGIYVLVCCFWYARREAVSLAVGSKGGSSTPIAISGLSGFGLFNAAALKALTAEPASDAEKMIKELGAVITDIQTLGDLGIQKWGSA